MKEKIKIDEELILIITDELPEKILPHSTPVYMSEKVCYLKLGDEDVPETEISYVELTQIILDIIDASLDLSLYYIETLIRFIGCSKLCEDFYNNPIRRPTIYSILENDLKRDYNESNPRVYGPKKSLCVFEFLEYIRVHDCLICIDPELVGEYEIVSGYKRQEEADFDDWCEIDDVVGNQRYPNLSLRLISPKNNIATYNIVLNGLLHSRYLGVMFKKEDAALIKKLKTSDCIISEMMWKNSYFIDLKNMPIINETLVKGSLGLCKESCTNLITYRDCSAAIQYLEEKGIKKRLDTSFTVPWEFEKVEKHTIESPKLKMEVNYYPLKNSIAKFIETGKSGSDHLDKLLSRTPVNQEELNRLVNYKKNVLRMVRYSNFKYIMSGKVESKYIKVDDVTVRIQID